MEPLRELSSVVAPLVRDNIDTDTIIPVAYMRSLTTDPGTGLFAGWRYRTEGIEDSSFVLNDPRYRTARILLAGANFGCGSSRENAVRALQRFGIRCVMALGFSGIFYENSFKNGLLPVVLDERGHRRLAERIAMVAPYSVTVDVRRRTIAGPDLLIDFDLDARKQAILLGGIDEITSTLALRDSIVKFRAQHRKSKPWLYGVESRASVRMTNENPNGGGGEET